MKEPDYLIDGALVPFSLVDSFRLKVVACSSPLATYSPGCDGENDHQFDRQYAAILLRERGF